MTRLTGMMFCPDCNADLDAVPLGEECPGCGGRRRLAIATPGTARARVTVPEPGIHSHPRRLSAMVREVA